ncbi:glycine betaine ABC transporter substrate-binding protein [Methylorubrum sp. SB2]|uniref:glycine betaine ABC transporter substrate-binding protein n=1 Tax=Methylorubrum subtropicum TaxID=3138812 RepID=UPI00313D374C
MRFRALARVLVVLALSACPAAAEPLLVVGKDFTEQGLVAELTRQLLASKGFEVRKIQGLSTSEMHKHMYRKEGDIYWEYTTTRLFLTYGDTANYDKDAAYARVRQLDLAKGYTWLKPTEVNNTYALAMRAKGSEETKITTISELFAAIDKGANLIVGINTEFAERPDGLEPLERAYGSRFPRASIRQVDTDYIYQALRIFGVDVGVVFATDGRISGYDLKILRDDKEFFFNYFLAPVVKTETAQAHPALVEALEALASKLDGATMTRLNAAVDVERRLIRDVAAAFLKDSGLVRPER